VGVAVKHEVKLIIPASLLGGFREMAEADFQSADFGVSEIFEQLDLAGKFCAAASTD